MDLAEITWRPGIGDPTIGGWVTVAVYAVTCIYAWRVVREASPSFDCQVRRQQGLWWFLLLALFALGINKQLDLQSLMTDIARVAAKEQGWYQDRKVVQRGFIVAVLVAALTVALALLVLFRKVIFKHGLAIIGFCFLLAFILVRATSFHSSDILIHSRWYGLKINWLLECGGLALIMVNANWLLHSVKRGKHSQTVQHSH